MPPYLYFILAAGWFAWVVPFFLVARGGSRQQVDRRARWGIVIQCLAYSALWQGKFWERSPAAWRIGFGIAFLTLASLLTWTSARTLGRQWRVDAGLNADHQLVQSGAYRVVRHPIYASMLCLLIGTGLFLSPLPLLLSSLALLLIGTEIRVRIEDGLLAGRFGETFEAYRRQVPAYVPFLR